MSLHNAARPALPHLSRPTIHRTQHRHASLLRRPKTPYTFTQLITLSDGSTFLHRTTSPAPIYKSIRDTKNNVLWNPSSQKLMNVEEDEAGRLRRFRARFGRGFDAEGAAAEQAEGGGDGVGEGQGDESLFDLIAGYKQDEGVGKAEAKAKGKGGSEGKKSTGKK
jgi:hypothetical protein